MSITRQGFRFGCSSEWMIRVGRTLLIVLMVSAFLITSGNAQQTGQAKKSTKSAKSLSKAAQPTFQPGLEPKAVEILKAASSRLAAARSMKFTAMVSYESPSRFGHPLVYATKSEVTMQRPDKLRVITPGDGPASEFYYDGKTMAAFSPAENLVAIAEAPSTIEAALKAAYDSAAIYFPFTDIIIADPYQGMIANGLKHAFYIGQSKMVDGTTTDMVATVDNYAFQQIWIGTDDKLPRKARAVFLADPSGLRQQIEFSSWQLDPVIPAETFASASALAATRISFARPDAPKPVQGMKPPAKAKASKKK